MTRRRIIFRPVSGVGFLITPEINGDSEELIRFGSADACDLNWPEMKAMFMGVQNPHDFETASNAVQRSFHSACADEILSVQYHLSLDDLRCDELYEIDHGDVKRVYGTNLIYVQIHYFEQESAIQDTAEFDCPPGIAEAEVMQAIQAAKAEMPIAGDEDRLTYMDDVLSRAAVALNASWAYVSIAGVVEME